MIEYFVKLKNYIPSWCINNVFEIDYLSLYKNGKRLILFDIDNTLVSYDKEIATDEINRLLEKIIKIGFEIVLVSNNNKKRVNKFASSVNLPFIHHALKPFSYGFKKAMSLFDFGKNETIVIGDQLMTDVKAARRMNIEVIMVKCLKRSSEKWYTRLNRRLEKKIVKRIEKEKPDIYKDLLKVRSDIYEN